MVDPERMGLDANDDDVCRVIHGMKYQNSICKQKLFPRY